jgi:DNA-binding transcriptional ArsR family regulator
MTGVSMDNDTKTILELLKSINAKLDRLDDLQNLLRAGQKLSLDESKASVLGSSNLRREIYKLCDGEHTVSEISHAIAKSMPVVSQVLSQLELAGLVAEKREGKMRYYQKLF